MSVHATVFARHERHLHLKSNFLIGTPHTTDRRWDRSKIKFYNKMFFNYFLLFIHPLFNFFFFIAQVLCWHTRRLSREQDNKYTSIHSDSYRLIVSTHEDHVNMTSQGCQAKCRLLETYLWKPREQFIGMILNNRGNVCKYFKIWNKF